MRLSALLLLAVLGLAACRPPAVQEQQGFVFGTRVELVVVSPDPEPARQAIAAILRDFDHLHRTYHAWQPSDLTRLNEAIAAGRPHPVSEELAGFIRDAQALTRRGEGLFDPGIGELVRLWGFHAEDFASTLPASDAVTEWTADRPSILDLTVDRDNVVHSRNRRVRLDFGGYLKGVALDRAADQLRRQGIRNALINIGGNLLALGDKAGRKWRVGIQHPRQSSPLATLTLEDGEAIGTSGDYQRYFEHDGQRYSHLLDPRRGRPADQTRSVTVLISPGPNAGTLSDASSKPVFIAGDAEWQRLARAQGITQVLRVDREGRVQVTAPLRQRLQFADPDLKVEVVD